MYTVLTETSCHLLAVLDFSQVTLTHVIVKRHTEIMQEQKMIMHVFLHTVQKCIFILLCISVCRRLL